MGSRGPIPRADSTESARRRNTKYRKTTGRAAEPVSVGPPDFVQANPAALAFWRRHAPALVAAGRLTPLQADAFALVAEQFAEVRFLTDMVNVEGVVIDTPRGPRENPKVRILRDARRDLLSAARGYGMDAVSDARLPAEPPEPELSVIDRFRAMKAGLRETG